MLTGHKIALFGAGRIGRLIYSGIDALHSTENFTSKNKENFLDQITKIVNKEDYKSLVNVYKNIQRKYYPEKDIYNKGK